MLCALSAASCAVSVAARSARRAGARGDGRTSAATVALRPDAAGRAAATRGGAIAVAAASRGACSPTVAAFGPRRCSAAGSGGRSAAVISRLCSTVRCGAALAVTRVATIVVRLLRLVVLRLSAMSGAIAVAAGLSRLAIVVVHASTVVRRPMPDEWRSRVRMPAVP